MYPFFVWPAVVVLEEHILPLVFDTDDYRVQGATWQIIPGGDVFSPSPHFMALCMNIWIEAVYAMRRAYARVGEGHQRHTVVVVLRPFGAPQRPLHSRCPPSLLDAPALHFPTGVLPRLKALRLLRRGIQAIFE
jgi:hypothetical protein